MKKLYLSALTLTLSLMALGSQAAPIVLNTGLGGTATFTLSGVAVGSTLSFEYQFSNVVFTGGSYLGINSTFFDPCCGAQFNDYRNANTGWLLASISTVGTTSPSDLRFTATTFPNDNPINLNNSGTVTIRNVAIDRQVIAGAEVPEPATLGLLAVGLLGLGMMRRRVRPSDFLTVVMTRSRCAA